MTDMPDTSAAAKVIPRKPKAPDLSAMGFKLEETYWGYRIVGEGPVPLRFIIIQSMSMIGGSTFLAGAVTLAVMSRYEDMLFRTPVVLLLIAVGVIAMWFASRGTAIQLEVDTMNGEVREVVRNRTGAQTVLSRYGFDCVGSVFIQRPNSMPASLVLRYRNTARTMPVASGAEADLARLRDRMGRDLIISREAA